MTTISSTSLTGSHTWQNVTRMSTDLLDKYFQGGEQDDIGPLDEGADSVAGQPSEGYSF